MSKIILLLATLGLFMSCKKSGDSFIETPVPETIKEMNFAVTGPKPVSLAPVRQGTGNFNFLGYGYNVVGKYADTSSVKAQVINIEAYAAAFPRNINTSRTTSQASTPLYAENAEDYLSKMTSSRSTDVNFFKGTITSAFPGQDAILNKNVYAQFVHAMTWKTITNNWDRAEPQNYLTSEFKHDVQNLTSENLVKKYGTHILSGVALGEKFNVYFQANSSANNKLHSSKVGFTYALNKVFGISTGYADPLKPNDINAISEPKLVYEAIGGDPSKITQKVTNKGTLIWYYDWIATCTEEKALFIDVVALTPLQDMIANPAKKAEVKNYITSYIQQNQVKM
ncbi:MAC/perforin domain-containing protein [Mucilaginibacter sp. PAMB04274]|uniref:MAC/perforin domain-containing protein n=1 Tax=Mucilaginibacter sp. PAMB04274 TaxID=3138568 RepID=UPI0031F66806